MQERPPFPAWLQQLCYFGGVLVVVTLYAASGKSDQRSNAEKLDRVVEDVRSFSDRLSKMEGRLPNREADDLRYKVLEEKVDKNRNELDFEIAKIQKWQEDTTRSLIKKGVID